MFHSLAGFGEDADDSGHAQNALDGNGSMFMSPSHYSPGRLFRERSTGGRRRTGIESSSSRASRGAEVELISTAGGEPTSPAGLVFGGEDHAQAGPWQETGRGVGGVLPKGARVTGGAQRSPVGAGMPLGTASHGMLLLGRAGNRRTWSRLDTEREPKPSYIIGPETRLHRVHEHLGDFLTLYVAVAIPLFVSFHHIENMHVGDWYVWNCIVDLLFIVDLVGHFLMAYWDSRLEQMVYRPSAIARHYTAGMFLPDLVAAVPLTLIMGESVFSIVNKVTRLLRLPRTMRLMRSIKELSQSMEEQHHQNLLLAAYNILKVCIYLLMVLHWVACGWHFLADVEDAEDSWIVKDGLEGAPGYKLYVTSVYWTVTTLSTVGYGDIFASTVAERTYCILVMLTGATMYALAIGAVSHIIASVVARRSHANCIAQQAEQFVSMHRLPKDLAEQVRCNIRQSGDSEAVSEQRAQETLQLLPPAVRTCTLLCIYQRQISKIAFLRERRAAHPTFVTLLASKLQDHVFARAGEELAREGAVASTAFFLVRGFVSASARPSNGGGGRGGREKRGQACQLGDLGPGGSFGVVDTLLECPRAASVVCVTDCEVYTLGAPELRRLSRRFPSIVADLRNASADGAWRQASLDHPINNNTSHPQSLLPRTSSSPRPSPPLLPESASAAAAAADMAGSGGPMAPDGPVLLDINHPGPGATGSKASSRSSPPLVPVPPLPGPGLHVGMVAPAAAAAVAAAAAAAPGVSGTPAQARGLVVPAANAAGPGVAGGPQGSGAMLPRPEKATGAATAASASASGSGSAHGAFRNGNSSDGGDGRGGGAGGPPTDDTVWAAKRALERAAEQWLGAEAGVSAQLAAVAEATRDMGRAVQECRTAQEHIAYRLSQLERSTLPRAQRPDSGQPQWQHPPQPPPPPPPGPGSAVLPVAAVAAATRTLSVLPPPSTAPSSPKRPPPEPPSSA